MTTAIANSAIFVAIDNDVKGFARRYGTAQRGDRFDRLNLIHLRCGEVLAAKRIDQAMSFVEHEWAITEEKIARRMWIDIGPHYLRSHR